MVQQGMTLSAKQALVDMAPYWNSLWKLMINSTEHEVCVVCVCVYVNI